MRSKELTASPSGHQHRTLAGTVALAGALALAAATLTTQAGAAQGDQLGTAESEAGTHLVDAGGLTLYYFTPDPPGVSVCAGDCLVQWPPLLATDGAVPAADDTITGTLAFSLRDDGTEQVTYRGRPLYYFAGDAAAGDINGQGLGDVWYVAAEDGSVPDAQTVSSPELILETSTTELGTFLVGADGMTAYYYSEDVTPGVSACSGDCLAAWPPVTVSDGISVAAGEGVPGVVGVTTATDGTPQVTYDGRPLYYFAGDQAAGDANGHGVGDVWWVATIDGLLPS